MTVGHRCAHICRGLGFNATARKPTQGAASRPRTARLRPAILRSIALNFTFLAFAVHSNMAPNLDVPATIMDLTNENIGSQWADSDVHFNDIGTGVYDLIVAAQLAGMESVMRRVWLLKGG